MERIERGESQFAGRVLGRRQFLAGTAATLGLVAASGLGCSPTEEIEEGGEPAVAPEEQVYQGLCRGNCGGGCRLNVHVREGRAVKISPVKDEENPLEELICPRGYTHPQRIYAPERVQYPMRRVEGSPRGGGEWERMSWDDAIAYICEKWKGYIEEFGNSSICYSFGAGTYAQNYYVYTRLFNLLGSTVFKQEYDMTGLNYSWRIFGMSLYLVGNCRKDQVNSNTVFCWSCNGTIGALARWKYVNEAMKRGGKLVVIDPVYTDIAAKADLWVPINITTDAALAMAMCKHIIETDRDDKEFLANLTMAPFLVKEDGMVLRAGDVGIETEDSGSNVSSNMQWGAGVGGGAAGPAVVVDAEGNYGLAGEIANPVLTGSHEVAGFKVKTAYQLFIERIDEWTLEKAAQVTGVSEDVIKQLCDMYLDGPTTLHYGWGNDHWSNGGSTCHAQYMLPIVTGQMGKPGTGLQGCAAGATTGFAGENWTTVYPANMIPGVTSALLYLDEIMETGSFNGQPLTPKSMFFYACNPLASHGGGTALRAALDKFDLIITADTVMNDTANYSDIVLPVPHWFEYETYRTCPSDFIDFQEKAIEPQFECKSDVEIAVLIGQGMGLGADMDFDDDSYHRMFLDSEIALGYGISWDTLKEQKHMRIAPEDYYYGSMEYPFVTGSGRAEFYFENVVPEFDQTKQLDVELLRLPAYVQPLEAYEGNPLKEKYPLIFMTHRDKFKVHTAFAKCPWALEIQPEPTIEMNPVDAEARGIAEGDYVKVYNERGYVVLKAHHDAGMPPGITWTEHTWLGDQYVDGHYSDVLHMDSVDFYPTNHPFDTLVEVEKYAKEA